MKRVTIILIIGLLLTLNDEAIKAQSTSNIYLSGFHIGDQFLKYGYLKVHPYTPTSFTAKANFIPLGSYGTAQACIVYTNPPFLDIIISEVKQFTLWSNSVLQTVDFNAVLPQGTMGGEIRLWYSHSGFSNYSNVGYRLFIGDTLGDFSGGIPESLQAYAKDFGPLPNIPMTFIHASDTTPALTVGSSIYSPNQQYRLTLQTDGNLVLYKRVDATTEQPLWASDQNTTIKAKTLFFQTDGNLVLYLGNSLNTGVAWASGLNASQSLGFYSPRLAYALQDDGNFVFYWLYQQGNEKFKWTFGSTNTGGGVVSPNFGVIAPAQ